MQLQSIQYQEFKDTPQEWTLKEFSLGDITLLAGRNSSGKSRVLNIIVGLAKLLSGFSQGMRTGDYNFCFKHDDKVYQYSLKYENFEVLSESLLINGETFLERGKGGIGKIKAENIDGKSMYIEFQTPASEVAAFARRDSIQHGFLENLYTWASSTKHYKFSSEGLGKNTLVVLKKDNIPMNDKGLDTALGVFTLGRKKYGEDFVKSIIQDFAEIEYGVDNIDVAPPISIETVDFPGEVNTLFVKENDLPGKTDQVSMSDGMYRVLALLIHINYAEFSTSARCILIDDIGEGLDFERSRRLVTLLRSKSQKYGFQMLLSTNDKFVMNEVPLEEWAIVDRNKNVVEIKNYQNAKDIFERFRFTGLSNFSFLEFDFLHTSEKST